MSGDLRWHYTHEVLDSAESTALWADRNTEGLSKGRRVSPIVRNLGQAGFFGVRAQLLINV